MLLIDQTNHHQRGETLLELIFAVTVVLVVLTSFLAVFISTNRSQVVDNHVIVASQLAREGVEIVRAIRDSNWLAGRPWSDNLLLANGDTTAVVASNITSGPSSDQIDFTPEVLADAPLYDQGAIWNHTANATPTGFTRLVTLEKICTDDLAVPIPPGGQVCALDAAVGARVTATVDWADSDRTRQYQLTTYLYDWR